MENVEANVDYGFLGKVLMTNRWMFAGILSGFLSLVSITANATTPAVINGIPSAGLSGGQQCFDSSFTHTGDAGFGPYIRVIADDTLSLDSASLFGGAQSITNVGTFPATAPFELEDPFTKTMVTGAAEQVFYIVRFNIGSVVPGGPALEPNLCVSIDASADIGVPINFSVTPVYRFGDTSTGDNGPIEGATDNKTITPELYQYTFSASAPEQEIAPSPSTNIPFVHTVDVADGSQIALLSIEQLLNNEMLATSSPAITGAGTCAVVSEPAVGSNGGNLLVDCALVSGSSASDDVEVSYTAVVDNVLNGASCASLPILHNGEVNGQAPIGNSLAALTDNASLVAKHITSRQSVSGASVNPGDIITITNDIQVSAHVRPNQLILTDTLSDGLQFNSHTSLTVGGSAESITPVTTTNSDGTVSVVYDISGASINVLAGQSVSISYTVSVEQTFRQSAQPLLPLDKLDISSALEYGLVQGASACSEDSSSSVTVNPISINKSISGTAPDFDPGDPISFLLRVNVPSGDISSFTVTDFLPLSLLKVADIDPSFGNDIKFSSNDTVGQVPDSLVLNASTNAIELSFANLTDIPAGSIIEYEVDAIISTAPFADGLTVTNIMQTASDNTDGTQSVLVSTVSFDARAPILEGTLTQVLPSVKDAGDSVEYTLALTNVGRADAFDIGVLVPAALGLEGAQLVSAEIDGVGATTSGSFALGDFLVGGPLAPNSVLEVVFSRVITDNVVPLQEITSTANAFWASAPTAGPFPEISTEQSFSVDNFSISTAVDSVSPEGSIGNVVVGDTVTYRTTVTLPESEVAGFNVDLGLPPGFEFVANSITVDSAGFVGTVDSSPSANVSGAVDTGPDVEVSFAGTLATTSDNNTGNNSFSFTFEALVRDSSVNTAVSSLQAKQLTSSADFTGKTGGNIASNVSSSFAEHNLTVSTVATNGDGATGSFQAGDDVSIVVTITNTGTAPAYDVIFDSIVNGDLFDLTTVSEVTTPPNYTYSYSSPTVSYTASNQTLDVNDSISFTYRATVKDGVRSGSDFVVTSNATGSSLDGMPLVERVGTVADDAILTTLAPAIGDLEVIATSESWSGTSTRDIFAIGEVVTYQFTATLPEGLTASNSGDPIFSVKLPNGYEYLTGTSLIRADFDTSMTSANEGAFTTTDSAITASVNGRTISYNLGDITNNDNDNNDETVTITFDLLVKNIQANNRGNGKSVSASIEYINQANVAQSTSVSATSNIGEPNLRLGYSVRPSTVAGGNTVIYQLVLRNARNTYSLRAWDIDIQELIPSQLTPAPLPLLSAVLSRGNTDISACASITGQLLQVDLTCLPAGEEYLGPNERITIRLEAEVDPAIRFEETATARTTVIATSLPGAQGSANATPGLPNTDTGERTGDRVRNTSGESVNDYFYTRRATITAESPTIGLSLSDTELQIGELLTLTSDIGLPTGSTEDFEVTVNLPAGLRYDNAPIRITLPASGFTSTLNPNLNPGAGASSIVLNFGEIANSNPNAESLAIEIDVIVDNILSNQNGSSLRSEASLDYATRGQNIPSDAENLTVIEANLDIVQTIISGATNSDAGDTIRYRSVVSNTSGQATAYNVSFVDVFDADLLGAPTGNGGPAPFENIVVTNPSNAVLLRGTNAPVSDSDISLATTSVTNDTLILDGTMQMPPNSSISIEYSVVVSNTATPGASLSNAIAASYDSNEAADSRSGADANSDDDDDSQLNNYNETLTTTVILDNALAIQSQLNAVHSDNDFTPGELVFIDVRLDVNEGQLPNTLVNNELPAGLSFVNLSIQSGANISYTGSAIGTPGAGNSIDIDFGTLTNIADTNTSNDFVLITIEAQVLDVASNVEGAKLVNEVSATGAATNVGPSSVNIDIVEPDIVATISSSSNAITLGDVATFTVDLNATDFSADAFDTVFEIVIPSGFTYQAGSLAGPGIIDESDPTRLVVDLGALSAGDGTRSFIFDAQLDNNAAIGANFEFEIQNGEYSSLSGIESEERDYSFTSSLIVASDDASFIDATQTMTLADDVNGNGEADPGDRLDKVVVLTNNGGRVSGVVFEEPVPANTTYVAGTLTSSQGTTDDSSGMNVDIGELQPNDRVTLNFSFEVAPGTPAGTLIQAQGSVDSDSTIPELTDADGNDANGDQPNEIRVGMTSILAPTLSLGQSISLFNDVDSNMAVSETDILTVSYTLNNTGNQALTNVQLSDLIPQGLSYVNGSLAIGGPADAADTASVSGGAIALSLANVDANELVTITLQVSIDSPLIDLDGDVNSELFSMQGSALSDQTSSILSDSNGNVTDGAQASTITAIASGATPQPDIAVSQTYVLTNDVDGDGLVDPGDTVRLVTSITNSGSTNANGVISQQPIPVDTTIVAGSEQTSRGVIANVGSGAFNANIGSIAPGETVITSFEAVIDGVTVDTLVSSQQSVSGNNFSNVDSDSNADLSDGATPTLISVVVGAAPTYTLNTVLSATSDAGTSGNNFIQGEELSLELSVTVPTGLTRDARLMFELPSGFSYLANTALVKRQFDNAVTSSENPGNVNGASNDSFVNVPVTENGNVVSLNLANITSTDADADGATYVFALTLDTSALVPSAQTQSFAIASDLVYNNEVLVAQMQASNDVPVVLNNQIPLAVDDTVATAEDAAAITITPLTNDSDPDAGQTLSIVSVGPASAGGSISFNAINGTIAYQNASDYSGVETFTYTVSDGAGGFSTATVTVNVAPTPDAPVANPDAATTNEDVAINIDVLGNDTDADNDTLSVTSAVSPNGTVSVATNGELIFTPAPDFNGTATIVYNISDGNGGSDTATVTVTVVPVNDPPTASGQVLSTPEDTALVIDPLINANDIDGDTLSVTNLTSSSGTVTLNPDGSVSFEPEADFTGPVTITYDVDDGNGGSVPVTIVVNVTPVNDAPVAVDDVATTDEDQPVTINVLANDTDAENDSLSVTSASSSDGTVTVGPLGNLVFTPNADFNGPATITYAITDGNGGNDTATVLVNVVPVNDPPTAPGQSLTTPEDTPLIIDPLLNANDIDGDTLTVTDLTTSSGTVTLNADGTVNFEPEADFTGPVTITYNVDDGNGGVVPVVITVDVQPVNDAPVANPDSANTVEDTPVTINAIANDTDPDGDPLEITNATSNDGLVVVLPSGELSFVPKANFNGVALINYTLADGTGLVDTGTVLVQVSLVNDIPVVPDQILEAQEDVPVTFDPLANGFDADGDSLTVSDLTTSAGTLIQNPDGTITFVPDQDFNGPVVVTYTVDDGNGGVITVTVDINVEPEIDPPVATPDFATTPEETPITINAVANDSDPDGDVVSITKAVSANGTVSIDGNGDVVFVPSPNFNGQAIINYTLSDGTGEVATGTITVDVTPVNDPPVVTDQTLITSEDTPLLIDPLLTASDVDGDVLSISNISVDSGTIIQNADGTLTFTPDPDFNGPVTLTYLVDDGNGGTAPATIFINVQAVVDAPVANPDTAVTDEDQPVTIDVLSNDTDADNDVLTVVQATSTDGTVVIDGNGDLVFTPNANFNGTTIINYVIEDPSGQVSSSTVTVDVLPINDPPVAPALDLSMDEDSVLNVDVIGAANDPDGDTLSITSISVDVGTVTVGPDGSVFFTPPENYSGPATISYTLDDGNGGRVTSVVNVDVLPINDLPELDDISVTVPGNTASVIDIVSSVVDPDSSTFTVVSATVLEGSVDINADGTITYSPPNGFEGSVQGEVCIEDDAGAVVCADLNITVVLTNTPPVAIDLNLVTPEDTSLFIDATASDAQNDSLTYTLLSMPNGMLTGSGPTYTYVPPADFNGQTSFTYQVSDGQESSGIATITIDVTPVNDAPIAVDDALSVSSTQSVITVDALANDSDPDGDALTIVNAQVQAGSVTIENNQILYTPIPGFIGDVFVEYTIEDTSGESASARVQITVERPQGGVQPPIIIGTDTITIDAVALFTKVDLGVTTAVDRFGNPLPVSILDGVPLYEPGVNTAFYVAVDSEGNRTVASRFVLVNPLISIQNDQTITEGGKVRVSVHLNGLSPSYPLVVPYRVEGSADASDHNLISGEVVFENNSTEEFIEFDTFEDGIAEGPETVVITLSTTKNVGNRFSHVVNIVEDNVLPEITLVPSQAGEVRSLILASGGPVTVESLIDHPDPDNRYLYTWVNPEGVLSDTDSVNTTFTFDPTNIAPGTYQLDIRITDIDDPSFIDTSVLFIQIVDSFPELSDDDADLDGITDIEEGFFDLDGDAIPAYLDSIDECNVLAEEASSLDRYLIEGDPGTCLRIGNFALGTQSGGAQIYESVLEGLSGITKDTLATNIGGIFNFIVYGLPTEGEEHRVVIPQRRPIPEGAVYRQYSQAQGWTFFDDSDEARLWSVPGEPGLCPPPGGPQWEEGLQPGYWCVQLEITDGGPNDTDQRANSDIRNLGFVGVVFDQPNELPDAIDDEVQTPVDTPITIDALSNDIDPDGDSLIITSVNTQFGIATIEDNLVEYTPAQGFSGVDEIAYGISDGKGGTDVAIITVLVVGNLPPIAVDDMVEGRLNANTTIDALANDSDPEGGPLTITEVSSDDGGVQITSDNKVLFTPNANTPLVATIEYTIADDQGLIARATITITITEQEVRIENRSDGGSVNPYFAALLLLLVAFRRTAILSLMSRSFNTKAMSRGEG